MSGPEAFEGCYFLFDGQQAWDSIQAHLQDHVRTERMDPEEAGRLRHVILQWLQSPQLGERGMRMGPGERARQGIAPGEDGRVHCPKCAIPHPADADSIHCSCGVTIRVLKEVEGGQANRHPNR